MAVLKAGAYGHGIGSIAAALENVDTGGRLAFFGVASVGADGAESPVVFPGGIFRN